MKLRLIGSFVCLIVFGMSSTVALAATPSARNARRATYNEINRTEASNEGIRKGEEHNIHCNRLTSTRYHCTFEFISEVDEVLGCIPASRGYSYVTFRRYGAEVNLHMAYNPCVERNRK